MMNHIMSASILLLLSLSCFLLQVILCAADHHDHHQEAVHLELIHRHAPEFTRKPGSTLGPPRSRAERIHELVHSDKARLRSIHQRLGGQPRRKAVEATKDGDGARTRTRTEIGTGAGVGEIIRTQTQTQTSTITPDLMNLPMRSAVDVGIGQYFVSIRVGKPPEKFIMLADTGSVVTWIKCQINLCTNDTCPPRYLNATKSPTFTPIPCPSQMCQTDLTSRFFGTGNCPNTTCPCFYDMTYADKSYVKGYFGNDILTIGLTGRRKIRMRNVIVGCGHYYEGVMPEEIDGILGLGYDPLSFSVKAAAEHGDHTFSYCLVDHTSPTDISNFLSFGRVSKPLPGMQYTKLLLGTIPPFYGLNVTGISLGDIMLEIPNRFLEVKDTYPFQGFILDSGSSLTCLSPEIFGPIARTLREDLMSRVTFFSNEVGSLDLCFRETEYNESEIPSFRLHFGDGAVFSPPVKSYVIEERPGVKCFTFTSPDKLVYSQILDYKLWFPAANTEDYGISVIGNIMQQNFLWEFDLQNRRLGFAPSSCTLPSTI